MMAEAIESGLREAMVRGMQTFGRDAKEATRHALILMAQSSSRQTPKAPARRDVFNNPRFAHLMRTPQYAKYRQDKNRYPRYFKYAAIGYRQSARTFSGRVSASAGAMSRKVFRYSNDRARIAKIANRGLAQNSWRWGMRLLGSGYGGGRQLPGVVEVFSLVERGSLRADVLVGREMHNRLSYVSKIMPAGWESESARRATERMRHSIDGEIGWRMGRALVSGRFNASGYARAKGRDYP